METWRRPSHPATLVSHPTRRLSRRPLGILVVLLLALVALAGCMSVDRNLTLNRDGSGVYVLTLGFREPTSGDPNSVSSTVTTPMEAFGAHVQQEGGSYRRYEDQGYAYWAFTRPFTSVSQANTFLQDNPQQYDPNHSPVLYQDSLRITTNQGLGSTTFHVAGTISLDDANGKATNWKDATERLAITLQGGVSEHKGGSQDGNTVTYTIHYNESATVDVTGSVSTGFPCGGSAALVIVTLGVWLLLRAKALARRS